MCPLAPPFDLGMKWNSPYLAAFVARILYCCKDVDDFFFWEELFLVLLELFS